VGFISEFVVFRGSIVVFPVQTLLSLIGTALTAVYLLLLVNRVFFGRLAIRPPTDAVTLDINLPPVSWAERLPSVVLALVIVALGIQPHWLSRWSEATSLLAVNPPVTVAQVSDASPVKPFQP
ncbi:MAG: NAD(P)H-quinone oxidoreductase subunit D4, partial [Leptolyngbyaceae cyanobacterium]